MKKGEKSELITLPPLIYKKHQTQWFDIQAFTNYIFKK